MSDEKKVVSLKDFRKQANPQDEHIGVRIQHEIRDFEDGHWQEVEPNNLSRLPLVEGSLHRLSQERDVNNFVWHVFSQGFRGAKNVGGIGLSVKRVGDVYEVSAKRQSPFLGIMSFPQNVFETALRLMDSDKDYHLTVTSVGCFSAQEDENYPELLPAFVVDPDFGPGSRYKSDEELDLLRFPDDDGPVSKDTFRWADDHPELLSSDDD